MRYTEIWKPIALVCVLFSCKKDDRPAPVPPPKQQVLLKEIEVPSLPSPYYHFDYNTEKKVTKVSYSSGLRMYDVLYNNGRMTGLQNNTVVNKDKLEYILNETTGHVDVVRLSDKNGVVYKRGFLSYNGPQLQKIEWERKVAAGYSPERTVTFAYHADGNLKLLTDHRHPLNEQVEATYTTTLEQYDNKTNVDGFTLLHQDDAHLLLLPDVELQKNNPGKLLQTGGPGNYAITYTYTYNEKNLPLLKKGDFIFTSGPNEGQRFETKSIFTYYE